MSRLFKFKYRIGFAVILGFVALAACKPKQAESVPIAERTLVAPEPYTPGVAAELTFSEKPTDEEICQARVFLEPLAPINGNLNAAENVDLAVALLAYQTGKASEDYSALSQFLKTHPDSRWKAALELNLGLLRYQQGGLSEALKLWESAWALSKDGKKPEQRAIADRAIGELLVLQARLGRVEELERYLGEFGNREVQGSDVAKIDAAKEGLWRMKNTPEIAFKCGPFAVNSLLYLGQKVTGRNEILDKVGSTPNGTNLRQVRDWAKEVGLDYQIAKRGEGAPVIVPSVMHWKLNHFAALTREESGKYLVQDPTFQGYDIFISPEILAAESDGYFLVPAGPLPEGWSQVSDAEGEKIWGKGGANARQENMGPGEPKSGERCPPAGMAFSSVFSMQARLNIGDTPLTYTPPLGPVMNFSLHYTYGESGQPSGLIPFPNFGTNWSFNWVSYLTIDASRNLTVRVRGGGLEVFNWSQANNITNSYLPDLTSQAVMVLTAAGVYERRLPNGGVELYDKVDGAGRIFLTKVIDPQGNAVTINYDTNFRITSIVDAIGQSSTLTYQSATVGNVGFYKITRVTDPFTRYASFAYDTTITNLVQITDVVNLTSDFTYDTGSFISSMTTPYGRTLFYAYTATPTTVPPPGDGTGRGLRLTYPDGSQSVVESWIGHTQKTFFWDRRAMVLYPTDYLTGDYTHCQTTTWLLLAGGNVMSPVPSSTKQPLENPVIFTYPDQPSGVHTTGSMNRPITVTRVLDDLTEQVYSYEYGALGNVTKSVDPEGRTFTYFYAANNTDLLEVRQTRGGDNELIGKWVYNDQHRPTLYIDGSGQRWNFAYNVKGQVTTLTDPDAKVTTNTYLSGANAWGYLTQVDGPLAGSNDKTTFTYDSANRVRTITDSVGYVLTFDYDNLNRPTKTTYPDTTFQQTIYDRLDPVFFRDRLSRWSQSSYDSMRQKLFDIDPLSRKTSYEWCYCGALKKLTDPKGNVTLWNYDLQGRLLEKVYADSTEVNYVYEAAISRIKNVTDALGQVKNYTYFKDNQLKEASYTNTVNPTSTVTYTYDANYPRVTSVANGWGTVSTSYNPYITDPWGTATTGAGRVQNVTNNVLDDSDIAYTYDTVGRVATRSIDGANNDITWTYDAMSRVTVIANEMGTFNYAYVDPTYGTTRLSSVVYPNGQKTEYAWFNNAGDQRLQQIKNLTPAPAPLSQFDYEYRANGNISKWTQKVDSATPIAYGQDYDEADQLVTSVSKNTSTTNIVNQYYYNYDKAANRTSEQVNTRVRKATANNLNQITGVSPGGATRFKGTISKAGWVNVNSNAATMPMSTNFFANPVLNAGTNNIPVVAYDSGSNTRTNTFQVVVDTGSTEVLTYDANGNTTDDDTNTYEWDAENRLIAINLPSSKRSEFTYDGLGRRVKIVEKTSGSVTSTKQMLYCGAEICEDRNASDAVTKRFYSQGQMNGSTKYFYTFDHLGSIREMCDNSGVIQARYDYDPYGRMTKVSGSQEADFQYAGYYYHAPSELNLTLHRAYDADLGRWLSRDPIGEDGGINLYGYVGNNPINLWDPYGLSPLGRAIGAVAGGIIGGAIGGNLGAVGGGLVGGGGGSLALPGGGTIGGGFGGAALGGALGAGIGAGLGAVLGAALGDAISDHDFNKNPPIGAPGSEATCPTKSGGKKQTRRYGADGYPETDTDWEDHGHGGPHVHDWGRPPGGGPPKAGDRSHPGRDPKPGDPGF